MTRERKAKHRREIENKWWFLCMSMCVSISSPKPSKIITFNPPPQPSLCGPDRLKSKKTTIPNLIFSPASITSKIEWISCTLLVWSPELVCLEYWASPWKQRHWCVCICVNIFFAQWRFFGRLSWCVCMCVCDIWFVDFFFRRAHNTHGTQVWWSWAQHSLFFSSLK